MIYIQSSIPHNITILVMTEKEEKNGDNFMKPELTVREFSLLQTSDKETFCFLVFLAAK